ncbi:MAG: 8-oxo-dGTP diphosphatase [Candidatus Buchananbacteria bacterium]|nr:8-oxo-dGTP diphosphatase [Candidatus Buchananbacteria bacterium]
MTRKLLTLVLVIDGEQQKILLGMKKRGFGAGRWNGFGGKVHDGETIEAAAMREFEEECAATITNLERVAIHDFQFESKMDEILEVHVFTAKLIGEPKETEEMRPEWFAFADIPYDTMWPDDRHWLPLVMAGKKLKTYFLFGEGDTVSSQKIEEVETL